MTLREYMEQQHLSFRKLASIMEMDAAQLARYASGKHLPSLLTARKFHKITKGKVTYKDWVKGIPEGGLSASKN